MESQDTNAYMVEEAQVNHGQLQITLYSKQHLGSFVSCVLGKSKGQLKIQYIGCCVTESITTNSSTCLSSSEIRYHLFSALKSFLKGYAKIYQKSSRLKVLISVGSKRQKKSQQAP